MQPRQRSKCVTISADSSPPAVERLVDQHDPAARRVGLAGPQHVRRAAVQAEAAVDAVLDQIDRDGRSGGRCDVERRSHQMPPTNTPGLQTRAGSKRSLTRRISSSAEPPVCPHGSTCARARIRAGRARSRRSAPAARRAAVPTAAGSSSTIARAERRPADQAGAAASVAAQITAASSLGRARDPHDRALALDRCPARWRSHSAASSSATVDLLQPARAHQRRDLLVGAARRPEPPAQRASRPPRPARQATSSASSSSGARASASAAALSTGRVAARHRARSRWPRAAGAGAR